MRREGNDAPDEAPRTADLAEANRAESADGLPLPAPDDAETRLARDAGEPVDASKAEEDEENDVAEEIAAERGAD